MSSQSSLQRHCKLRRLPWFYFDSISTLRVSALRTIRRTLSIALAIGGIFLPCSAHADVWPGVHWATQTPAEAGLARESLEEIAAYLEGRGCIIRKGYLVYQWGDIVKRGDVASAVKPWFSTFLFMALEQGKIESLDTPLATLVPSLNDINPDLNYKDREITFRHAANQTSCYGVTEAPGTAFDYNDWQMALFADTLFSTIYDADWDTVDEKVLGPMLTDVLGCEDAPTLSAFGQKGRRGRLGISPRDFARFGLLYLREGRWRDRQVLSREHATMAVSSPLPAALPQSTGQAAEMIPGQRSLGSERVPDNQTDHYGSYSWLWWVNGADRDGERRWPDAPANVFCALGHRNGQRGIAVVPGLDVVISWNDTSLGERPESPQPLNEVFRLLNEAAEQCAPR